MTEGCEAICVTTVAIPWELPVGWSEPWEPVKACGLRREIWPEHCSGDGHHNTYFITKPSPPPSSPRIPIPKMSAAARAAVLNARFRSARPSSDLSEAGLVMHQFDRLELKGQPWLSCNYHCDNELNGQSLTGRISTSIMYGGMQHRDDRVAVPLVSNDGGIIAHPQKIIVECAFGIDGATVGLNGGPHGDGCPAYFCDPSGNIEANGFCGFWGAPPNAAWAPKDLGKMLELHQQFGEPYGEPGYHSGYNEAVVDGLSWNANMPNTIEAFFMLEGAGVELTPDKGRGQAGYAREAHRNFLERYDLTEEEVPLLAFDPSRWSKPFRVPGSFDAVESLNERFRANPYSPWPEDGALSFDGVLIHCIDGYENHDQPWLPDHPLMSASLIFRDQQVAPDAPMPLFTCVEGGVIFRPGPATKLICGNAGDSGGGCNSFCDPADGVGDVAGFSFPGDGCGSSWRPKDFGNYLARVSKWQQLNGRQDYNEIIVEGAGPKARWSKQPSDTVAAFFVLKGSDGVEVARYHHANFLRAFGLSAETHPLVTLDSNNWEAPFEVPPEAVASSS